MNKLHTYICICKWVCIYRHTCNIYVYAYICVHIFIHTRLRLYLVSVHTCFSNVILVSSILLKHRKDLKGVKPMESLCALIG